MAAGSTYNKIATTTLANSTSNTVTFSSIPATYTDIVAVINGTITSAGDSIAVRFNSDSGANYQFVNAAGNGTVTASNLYENKNYMYLQWQGGFPSSGNATSVLNVQNYANTSFYKSIIARTVCLAGPYQSSEMVTGTWFGSTGSSTEAINSITFIASYSGSVYWTSGTTITIYGIAAA